jgi:CubicO group peptidase (beta-lactamase class C family)
MPKPSMKLVPFWAVVALSAAIVGCSAPPPAPTVSSAVAAASRPAPVVVGCGVTDVQLRAIETLNAQAVDRGFAKGMVTSLFCDGREILNTVAGQADGKRERPASANDLFRIYSMTKPITVLAAMILVEEGKLGIDEPVSKYVPAFAKTLAYAGGESIATVRTEPLVRPITVRDLMRHTAGIPYLSDGPHPVGMLYSQRGIDHGAGNKIVPKDGSAPVASVADLTERIAALPVMFQPGERFTYGNAHDVLGHIVALVAKQDLRDFLAQRIFTPLGMRDTSFEVPADKIGRLTAVYAARSSEPGADRILRSSRTKDLGRGNLFEVEDPQSSIFAKRRLIDFGGAGLVSTAGDYQRFLQMMLGQGTLGGVKIVSPATVAEMTREQLSASALGAPKMAAQGLGYGLGFGRFADPSKLPYGVPKGGYFWGGAASTNFWVDPNRKLSGVVMAQVFGGDVMPFYLDIMDTIYAKP